MILNLNNQKVGKQQGILPSAHHHKTTTITTDRLSALPTVVRL
jgi:hypothetical protein